MKNATSIFYNVLVNPMLKIYAPRAQELRLLPLLAEFKARVITNYPIKGRTRKIAGKNAYKVIDFPIEAECWDCKHGEYSNGKCQRHDEILEPWDIDQADNIVELPNGETVRVI